LLVPTQRLQDGEGSTLSRAIRREDGGVPELRSDLLERVVALGFNGVGGLLDVDFSATAPDVPTGAVALHATQHRRLGTVALGSSSSPWAPLSSTPLERWCTGRGKIPRRRRTGERE
jgi:hypothetical protein